MCTPAIIEEVRNDLSRRRFLAALGGGAIATAASVGPILLDGPVSAQQKPLRMTKGFRDVFDLTHIFSPALPVYPAYKPIQIRERFTLEKNGFAANEVIFDEHTGTHVDAPVHFVANAASADRIPAERLIAPLAVISIAARAAKDPDALVTMDDLLGWEKSHGRLPAGAFVAMHSGWDTRANSSERFLNRDAKGTMHAPGFSAEASRFLVEQREIVGAGVDTLSLDAAAAQKFVAHLTFLGAGKYGVELMANLAAVPASGATIIVGGPKHEGATGGPARVFAVA